MRTFSSQHSRNVYHRVVADRAITRAGWITPRMQYSLSRCNQFFVHLFPDGLVQLFDGDLKAFWFCWWWWRRCGDGGTCMKKSMNMTASSNGNIFRVTGHLCREFTGHRWIPRTKASDAELWCFLWSDLCLDKRLSKQLWGWWFETPSRPLWRHCDELCQIYSMWPGMYISRFKCATECFGRRTVTDRII